MIADLLTRGTRGVGGVKLQNICSGELPYRRYIYLIQICVWSFEHNFGSITIKSNICIVTRCQQLVYAKGE